jgi:uncharacterized protein (DUF1800 family)
MKLLIGKSLVLLFLFAANGIVYSQDDPDPNSPAPILLSSADGTRILTSSEKSSSSKSSLAKVYWPGRNNYITIYVSNIELTSGEEHGSVRVYLAQKSGKSFELYSGDLVQAGKRLYSLRVGLFDPDGLRGQPIADGDSLIYITWRGLVSNFLRIGLGSIDNQIKIPLSTATKISSNDYVGYRFSGDRIRFQEQAAFGPSTNLDNRLRRIGLRTWLADQFDAPYPTIAMPDPPQMPTTPPSDCSVATNPSCFTDRYTMSPLQKWLFREAFYGDTQLRLRTAWSLSQIWVTSGVTTQQSSHEIAFFKILMRNAFGNYRDLMTEVTLSPTMGNYLDMVRSTKANPNENYPREIMQLFTVGLFMLNQDGTLKLDPQGNPIPTYDQETINNLSKVFTGWSFCNTTCSNSAPGVLNYKDPMILVAANHDLTAKTLLTYSGAVSRDIPACASCTTSTDIENYANNSLRQALDNLFYHPNVGPFIGKLLIQHLVTSDPSPAYVSRVAAVFNDNGSGTRGDLKAVIKAILLDPEARGDVKTAPRYGKLREPVQLLTNLGRIFPARAWNGIDQSDGALQAQAGMLGENPFNSPTVFNYFTPSYIIPSTTVLAPEFEILNTTTAAGRTNVTYVLVFDGVTPNATDSLRGTSLDYSEVLPLAQNDASGNQLLDALNTKMMHGTLSAEQRASILNAVLAVPTSNPLLRVKTAVYLLAASSQYQIQR